MWMILSNIFCTLCQHTLQNRILGCDDERAFDLQLTSLLVMFRSILLCLCRCVLLCVNNTASSVGGEVGFTAADVCLPMAPTFESIDAILLDDALIAWCIDSTYG